MEQDNDYDGGKVLPQVVFPDKDGKVRKLTYDPVGTKEVNGMQLKEPVRVSIKTNGKNNNPTDLSSVRNVKFDKSFKKAKVLTDSDMYIFSQMPNIENIDVSNVKHVSNFDEHFKKISD